MEPREVPRPTQPSPEPAPQGWLGWVERMGNRLPDPVGIFLIGLALVFLVSQLADWGEWTVERQLPVLVETADGAEELVWETTGQVYQARGLLSSDGIYWLLSTMVDNFIQFPPLGVVLAAMLGIGLADRTGLIPAGLRAVLLVTPAVLLTPSMVMIGILSSMTLDAGYVLLIPLAGAIYHTCGRSPVAGMAAAYAGVSAGFSANLFLTSLDPMLAGFSQMGAQTIDPNYQVSPAANLYFMIVSTFVITALGWAVTSWVVEPRLRRAKIDTVDHDAAELVAQSRITPTERRGLWVAGTVFLLFLGICIFLVKTPGMPLHGPGEGPFARWVEAIVPLILLGALLPGIAYGITVGTLRSDRDLAKMMGATMADMAPIVVLAFFAAQFIEAFRYSGLDAMLAVAGGQFLGQAELPRGFLILAFIAFVMFFNLFIGSMSAKYALLAPIFVPMLMLVGISPELTQVAYRIGDSVTNIITPLMPYIVIILVFIRKYAPNAGIGTLIATMLPYTIAFSIGWSLLLLLWIFLGIPLGPDGALFFDWSDLSALSD